MAALTSYAGGLLRELAALLPAIKQSPAYAGVAFYGRFQAVNLPLIKKVAASGVAPSAALEAIRAGKALRVAASAKVGWDLLLKEDPSALLTAIYLNLCTPPVNVRVAKEQEDDAQEADQEDDEGINDEADETDDDDAH